MKLNNYTLCLAGTVSLCCLLTPRTVAAKDIFLQSSNFADKYQKKVETAVTRITETSDYVTSNFKENFTSNTANLGNNANDRYRNLELKISTNQSEPGLAAKSGKKPPRKG